MRELRALALGLFLTLASFTGAFAQCGTTAPANKFCGNDTGVPALATWKSIPAGALTPIAGGTVLGNPTGALAVPIATTAPVLGIPGTSTGQLGLAGLTSGTAVLRAQAVAGSAVSLLPTAAGTLVGTATAPLAINAATGLISITGQAGGVLAGAGPAFTRTPVLGVNGTAAGTLGFAGLTSGTATITPQAVAGSPTLTLPTGTGTFAVTASAPVVLNAGTGNLTCPTCVTSSGGGAITGTAPISVSAAGVVSINAPYVSLTASNGGLVYSDATNLNILAGTATAGQIPRSGSSSAPSWSTATYPATTAAGSLLVSATANTITATPTPTLGVNGGTGGQITLNGATSGSGIIRVNAAAGAGIVFQLPSTNGSNTNVLQTDGAGNTSWSAAGSGTVTTLTAGTDITLSSGATCTTTCTINVGSGVTRTIASGSLALNTTAVASATCGTAQTATATGTATTDTIAANFNGDPTAVTGYVPLTTGMLTIISYPTVNTVNFKVCNNTGASITPGAVTINWRVVR
jgi:hypothetical protein